MEGTTSDHDSSVNSSASSNKIFYLESQSNSSIRPNPTTVLTYGRSGRVGEEQQRQHLAVHGRGSMRRI